jgi:DNA-binding response OmpR family regulator
MDTLQGADTQPPTNQPAHKKVLVIDDSRTIVDLVRRAVEMQGSYDVIVAYDGVQGLEQYQREHPDCVIVDVMMPNMDGFQLVRCLRGDRQSAQTPLIILTALGSSDKRLTGLLSGADEYVVKPFKPAELCASIERVLAMTPEEREQRLLRLAGESAD